MVDDEFDDHPELSTSGFLHETPEILQRTEIGIDVAIVRNIVAVVAAGGGIERQQPERGDAKVLQVVELFGQSGEVADAVVIAVGERLDVQLINDCVLEPQFVGFELGIGPDVGSHVHGTTFTPSNGRARQGPAADQCASERRPTRSCAARR